MPGNFIQSPADKVNALTVHDYSAKQQSNYLQQIKNDLSADEVNVIIDFAGNYSFVIQSSAQGFCRDEPQASVHTGAGYYNEQDTVEQTQCVWCVKTA